MLEFVQLSDWVWRDLKGVEAWLEGSEIGALYSKNMTTQKQPGKIYEIGPFRLDTGNRILLRDGLAISLTPKSYDLLELLVERRGDVLHKDQLMERVWPGTFVEEANLSHHIYLLRKALGDDRNGATYIETVPKRGYRFVAPVREVSSGKEGNSEQQKSDSPVADIVPAESLGGDGASSPAPPAAPSAPINAETPAAPAIVSDAPSGLLPRLSRRTMGLLAGISVAVALVLLGFFWFASRREQSSEFGLYRDVRFMTSAPGMETQPALSPDGHQVAFAWDGEKGDNWDVYVKGVEAGSLLRLTNSPWQETSPAWSPDGQMIAFHRNTGPDSGFYVIPAMRSVERKIAPASRGRAHHRGHSLDWTPDGKHLLVVDRESLEQPFGIWRIDVDTGQKICLVSPSSPSTGVMALAVSPDGTQVAFTRLNDNYPDYTRSHMDLYVMPVSGGVERRLTFDNEFVIGMSWTPDSQEIVFACYRSAKQSYEWGSTLWRVPYRGGEPRLVSSSLLRAYNPTISKNGTRLVYEERLRVEGAVWRQDLLAGGELLPAVRIAASARIDYCPQISPDSHKIAFGSFRTGSWQIWVSEADGSNAFQVTNEKGVEIGPPRWSPDGTRIAFRSSEPGMSGIHIVDVVTRASRRLSTEESEAELPSWSEDGKWIYFCSRKAAQPQVWKVLVDGGRPVQVTRSGGEVSLESVDGKFLYFTRPKGLSWTFRESSLWKIPTEGGAETLVMESVQSGHWGISAKGICFVDFEEAQESHFPIQFFDFRTGKTRTCGWFDAQPDWNTSSLSVSRDGRWMISVRRERMQRDLKLVENFR